MFQQLQSTSARSTFQQLLPKPVNIQQMFQQLEGNPSTSNINSCRLPNQLFRRALALTLLYPEAIPGRVGLVGDPLVWIRISLRFGERFREA